MSVKIKEIDVCYSCNGCETDKCASYEIVYGNGLDTLLCQHCMDELKLAMIKYESELIESNLNKEQTK